VTAHTARSTTLTVNGCDSTPPTATRSSEQKYSDLTASNQPPSTLYCRNTHKCFSRGTPSYVFSRSTKIRRHSPVSTGFWGLSLPKKISKPPQIKT